MAVSSFLAVFLAVLAVALASQSIMLQVEPKTEECFYVDVTKPDSYTVIFTVTRGGKLDIYLSIVGPNDALIHKELYFFDESREDFLGQYTVDAANRGTYSICFDNTMSRYTAKVVSFTVTSNNEVVSDTESLSSRANPARKGDLDPIEWGLSRVNNGLLNVEKEQSHYRIREAAHRELAERTSSRVLFFTVMESVVLFVFSGVQIWLLRRWFNRRAESMS